MGSAWKPNYAGRGIVPGRSDREKGFILPKEPAPKMTTYQRATAAIERYWEQRGASPQTQQHRHDSPGRPGAAEAPGGERDIAHKTREACWKDSVNLEQVPGWWQPSYPGTPRDLEEKETVRVRGIPGYTGNQAKAHAAAQPDQAARLPSKPADQHQVQQYSQQAAYDHDGDTLASAMQDQLSVQRIHAQSQAHKASYNAAAAASGAAAAGLDARVLAQQQPHKPWMQQASAPQGRTTGSYGAPSLPASAGGQHDAYSPSRHTDQVHANAARGVIAAQPAHTDYIERSPATLNSSLGAEDMNASGLDNTWGSGSGMATGAPSTLQAIKTASAALHSAPGAPAAYRQQQLQPQQAYSTYAADAAAAPTYKQMHPQQHPHSASAAAGRQAHGGQVMVSAGRPATQPQSDVDGEQYSPRFFDDGVELPLESFQAPRPFIPASSGSLAHDRDVNKAPAAPAATWQPTHLPQQAPAHSAAANGGMNGGFGPAAGGAAHAAARAVAGGQYGYGYSGGSPRRASAVLSSDSPRMAAVGRLTAAVGPNTSTYAASYKAAGPVQPKAGAMGSAAAVMPYGDVAAQQQGLVQQQQQAAKHMLLPDTRWGVAAYGGVRNNASNLY